MKKAVKRAKRNDVPSSKPGPKADVLKLHGKWQDAVRQSLKKKKPEKGWPK